LIQEETDRTKEQFAQAVTLIQEETDRTKEQFAQAVALIQEETKEQFAHIERQFHVIEEQLDRQGRIEAQLSELNLSLSELATRDEINERITHIQTQEHILVQRQIELDERVRQNTSYLRLMQQQAQIGELVFALPVHEQVLTGEELINLIQILEHQFAPLAQANAIELSIQDEQAEPVLVAVTSYLGQRMASAGFTYRMPNDAWYHVDFTSVWSRSVLFKSANARLTPGGFFALITTPKHTDVPNGEGLHQVSDTNIVLSTQKHVRVLVWQSRTQ